MGSLHIVIELHITFNLYKFELIAQDLCTYSEEIVQEFCYSYVSTLTGSIDNRARTAQKGLSHLFISPELTGWCI